MSRYDALLSQQVRGDDFGAGIPTLLASAARTTTGQGAGIYVPQYNVVVATLIITAVSGTTPNLTVSIDSSPDNSTWTTLASFAAQTTTTAGVRKVFTAHDSYLRASWVITGTTPSFTFTVGGYMK